MDIQTEEYLEVLSDRPEEKETFTQTPASLDRPSSPLFVRAKIGEDVETQILPGDLFDFDLEVEPLLEVLVGKTIHVAMLEVMQEEELEAIRLQQAEFEAVRNIELAEVQRLEAEVRRKTQEKARRLQQEQQRIEEQRKLESKVAARAFAEQYLGLLHDEVFDALEAEGRFVDPLRREVEEVFMPELLASVKSQYTLYLTASNTLRQLLDDASEEARQIGETAVREREEAALEAEVERLRLEEEVRLQQEEAKAAAARDAAGVPDDAAAEEEQ